MGKDAKHIVRLTINERMMLDGLIANSRTSKDRALRARVFLKADADGPNWSDSQIAEAFEISEITVARWRKRCVFEGLEWALSPRVQQIRKPHTLDGAGEARLVALACSEAPEGRCRWTLQLLADKLVELKIVDEISDETVRTCLKKTNCNRGVMSNGSFPPTPTPTSCATWKTC